MTALMKMKTLITTHARALRIVALGTLAFTAFCADYELLDDPDRVPGRVTLEIDTVTDSSVTLRWTQCTDDDFKRYAVYYGTDDIVDRGDKLADSLLFAVDTVKIVRPLDDMTRYYFRVIVYNEAGKFSVSNIVDTVTPENMRGKLKLRMPSLAASGAVTLHWSKALETVGRYVIHADTTKMVDTADTLIATVYSDTAETIDGLLPGRTWWFRVYARNDTTIVATSNISELKLPEPQ